MAIGVIDGKKYRQNKTNKKVVYIQILKKRINMNHIMIDLETMGTGSNAVVVSISAVIFDMATGEIGESFEAGLEITNQKDMGGEIDADTVNWWNNQDQDARDELERLRKIPVDDALALLNDWVKQNFKAPSRIKLWGNGATFDNVIIRNLFKRYDTEFAIPYYCDKDVRTLTYLTKINPRSFEFEGVKHRGIDDCKHQIKYCVAGYKKISELLK